MEKRTAFRGVAGLVLALADDVKELARPSEEGKLRGRQPGINLDIRTRRDDNGRDGPCVGGPPEATTGAEAEKGEDKNCCCDWVTAVTERLVFFIEERGGGGGRLWRVRYWEEEEEESWRLSEDTWGGWVDVVRLRCGRGEGRGCRWRGLGTGLR